MKKTYLKPALEIVSVDTQLPIAISFDGDNGWTEVQDECDSDVVEALCRTIIVTY